MATNLGGGATHGPSRGLPFTKGSFLVSSLRSCASDAGASVDPSMSFTLRDRSRNLPSASIRPGFSLPAGPLRTSFMVLLKRIACGYRCGLKNGDVCRGGVVSFAVEFRAEFTRRRAIIVSGFMRELLAQGGIRRLHHLQ